MPSGVEDDIDELSIDNTVDAGLGIDSVTTVAFYVLNSYRAMREYLRQVQHQLEHIAPRLSENAGLVARLSDLEESWEIGRIYLRHRDMRESLRGIVAGLHGALLVVPDLQGMCDSCDSEWLMMLPRVIWLSFLVAPRRHFAILKHLLPNRFRTTPSMQTVVEEADVLKCVDDDLGRFHKKFWHVRSLLVNRLSLNDEAALDSAAALGSSGSKDLSPVWKVLVRRASNREDSELTPDVSIVVQGFMHDLERWSLELQRHSPPDWNQCSSMLMRCLSAREGDDHFAEVMKSSAAFEV